MKENLTEVVFILDRSGSMGGLEGDTIGGFNSMMRRQKDLDGEAVVTTVLFDDRYELLHNRVPIKEVLPMTDRQYYVRGTTALLDAVGRTIRRIRRSHRSAADTGRPGKVIFVIITDGLENASQKFSRSQVQDMIRQCREAEWEFLFLGANMDAVAEAESLGIEADRAANYQSDSRGTVANFEAVGEFLRQTRSGKERPDDRWKKMVEARCAGHPQP